jgi:hypothetical protein
MDSMDAWNPFDFWHVYLEVFLAFFTFSMIFKIVASPWKQPCHVPR